MKILVKLVIESQIPLFAMIHITTHSFLLYVFLAFIRFYYLLTKQNRGLARAPTATTEFSVQEDLAACGTDATAAIAGTLFRARRPCGTHQ